MYKGKRFTRNAYKARFFLKNFPLVLQVIWMYLSIRAKQFWIELQWRFDYYIAYMLYNPHKRFRYHRYMLDKWGDRYRDQLTNQD